MENIHFYPGDDEDNEFAFEIAESTAKAAQAAFEREDWTATIVYIEELMHGIKRGSFRLSFYASCGFIPSGIHACYLDVSY
jgi:hypothetical protein